MNHIKHVALFLVIFFVGQALIAFSLKIILVNSQFRYSKLYKGNMENKLLCIGNSRGVNSFYSPYVNEKYGIKSFNISYNGLNVSPMNVMLQDYLERNAAPEKVYIEVSNVMDVGGDKSMLAFNLYSGSSSRINQEIKENSNKEYWISNIFPLYRFNNELFYRSLFYLNKSDQSWINRYKISKDLILKLKEQEPVEFAITEYNIAKIKETVALLKEKKIETVLFVAPYLPHYAKKITNLDEMIEKIQTATGTKVLNLSNSLENIDYFADRVHTNEKGAEKIVDLLLQNTAATSKEKY